MAAREPTRTDDRARTAPRATAGAHAAATAGSSLAEHQSAIGNRAYRRRLPGFVQARLEVSAPGDTLERDADRVADAVLAQADDAARPQVEEVEEEEVVAPSRLARQPEVEEVEEVDEEHLAPRASAAPEMRPTTESAINRSRGAGHPLGGDTRGFFEPRFGRDLSGVKVHADAGAARLASDLGAQAFTVGRDIYFAEGRYQPGTQSGRSLLAHELAHTVQQQPGGKLARAGEGASPLPMPRQAGRQVQRDAESPPGGGDQELAPVFQVPQVKARHLQVYQAWASSRRLRRSKTFERGDPNQRDEVWIPRVSDDMKTSAGSILESERIGLTEGFSGIKHIRPRGQGGPSFPFEGSRDDIVKELAVPRWDRQGQFADLHVDHIVELQVAGWPPGGDRGSGAGNDIENMELLLGRANTSAGGKTRWNVLYAVADALQERGEPHSSADAQRYIAEHTVEFPSAVVGSGRYAGSMQENRNQWWTRDEITAGDHLAQAEAVNLDEVGKPDEFALFSPLTLEAGGEQRGGRALLGVFPHGSEELEFGLQGRDRTRVAGLTLSQVSLRGGYPGAGDGADIGSVQAQWALPAQFGAGEDTFELGLHKLPGNQYAGYLGNLPFPGLDFPGLSLIQLDAVTIDAGGVTAAGRLSPSLPLLSRLPIEVRLRGAALEFAATYTADDLELPLPGLHIDTASVGLVYSTADGFGAEGGIDFRIERLGLGRLGVGVSGAGELAIEGGFAFDSDLFDEAAIDVWYREGAFGGQGRLAITDPGKVPGVRSARVTATIQDEAFAATGTVEPAVPGVEQAELAVSYSEAEGLAIGGTLNLSSAVPGIESGSVEATVRRASDDEGWKLTATGRARPSIPGVDAAIVVAYDDGILTAEGTAAYDRGFLSGSLRVGATNQPLDADGNPTGEAGDALRAFGGGSLTLRLAPWLQATAGVRVTPEGEVEVTGRIGLPAALEVFPARRYDRNIFSIDIDIPIFGVTVPIIRQNIGIFATIGGGLDLTAGFGPGELRDLGLEITYNPDREEETEVRGGAQFVVPADAGLRLFIRGALGAGIPVVSARLGLEIGGQLGIQGAVRAGVEVAWTPSSGIELDAEAEIFAEPSFKFDITGFALVEASVRIWSFELYSKRWQLAAFEYGSGLRLGATFPIHYVEGEPFDVSLDDIEFQVPDIDPRALLSGLVRQLV